MLKRLVSACAVAVLACAVSTPASAQTFDQRTFFTFNSPVTLPGVTLAPGTYMFRLANPADGRNVVEVADESGRHVYATLPVVTAERLTSPTEPQLSFMKDTNIDMAPAVQAWWPPDDNVGYEFVYPKAQEQKLARRSDVPVAKTAGVAKVSKTTRD